MALDVGVYAGSNSKDPLQRDLVVGLEDGELAFLYDVFEDIKAKTGVEIVPWDDARLEGGQLDLFDNHLMERIAVVEEKDAHWDEYVGFQVKPNKKKIYAAMNKLEVMKKLNNLRELIRKAKEEGSVLFFFGD